MTTQITIHPLPEANLSPYQSRAPKAPDIVNDDFFANFADILDVINPLQQIPGISTAYRALTGDKISFGARIAGGFLLGGPVGLFASIANAIIEQETGGDIGKNLFAAVAGKYQEANQLARHPVIAKGDAQDLPIS